MSENIVLKNGANGFEILTDSGYSFNCEASAEGNVITLTSTLAFKGIRYGYAFQRTAVIVGDLSKTVTIYDEEGLPCDLFLFNF